MRNLTLALKKNLNRPRLSLAPRAYLLCDITELAEKWKEEALTPPFFLGASREAGFYFHSSIKCFLFLSLFLSLFLFLSLSCQPCHPPLSKLQTSPKTLSLSHHVSPDPPDPFLPRSLILCKHSTLRQTDHTLSFCCK